ncbi:MAG: endonuclease/exonuclease/phosphatase family protein [Myxococcota bacterium]
MMTTFRRGTKQKRDVATRASPKAERSGLRYRRMMRATFVLFSVAALAACGSSPVARGDAPPSRDASSYGLAPPPEPLAPPATAPALRVMSYNVNYGLAGDGATIDAIAAGEADVVLLQETTPAWEVALRRRFSSRYPHMTFHHCCGAGGLAALSVHPVRVAQRLEPSDADAWFPGLRLVVDSHLGPVQMVAVHLRPPVSNSGSLVSGLFTTPSIRRRQIGDFFAAFDPKLPTVVAGDFNEGSSGRAVSFLGDRGFRDALPPGGAQSTWRWNTSLGPIEQQLDHIMHDAALQPTEVVVRREGNSDHLPLVATFILRPAAPSP